MTHQHKLDHWLSHDRLTVVEAAHLIIGRDPGIGNNDATQLPEYVATFSGLTKAIRHGDLVATLKFSSRERGYCEEPEEDERLTKNAQTHWDDWLDEPDTQQARLRKNGMIYRPTPDWNESTVRVPALCKWLTSRGSKPAFFFPNEPSATPAVPEYLDPQHPRYAPKLAACVFVWQAAGKIPVPPRTHPKQLGRQLLVECADQFGLTTQGIDECSAVINWQRGGPAKAAGE